jgi:A/G-specific adenine glycosylase
LTTDDRQDATALTPQRARRLQGKLLAWYDQHRRDLPWRRTRDPYAIWISEAMLQQTRVETVIPYYQRFLEALPDVQSLADASEESVYKLWAGLGYYSRARNLRAAARKIVDEWDGELPSDGEQLRELPGVGRYTAGAVSGSSRAAKSSEARSRPRQRCGWCASTSASSCRGSKHPVR